MPSSGLMEWQECYLSIDSTVNRKDALVKNVLSVIFSFFRNKTKSSLMFLSGTCVKNQKENCFPCILFLYGSSSYISLRLFS